MSAHAPPTIWAVVVAAAALTLVVALPLAFGDRPHTVLTGSMEPTISAGDVVIDARISPLDARVGDVVTFRDPEDQSKLITHRVKRIRRSGSHLWFVTQGDANNTTEHWRIAANGELGRVVYAIPWIGHVAVLTHTPWGLLLLVVVPLLLLAGDELVKIWRRTRKELSVTLVRPLPAVVGAAVVVTIGFGAITPSFASFSSRADNPGNSVIAASDFRAPQVTAVALGKASGETPGFVRQGGSYFVYANVAADTGNPASGTASVTADASNFTLGATAVALAAGSYSAGGVSYSYRSASLLANVSLAQGAKSLTVTATDKALNAASLAGSATVDNTAPAAADVQTTNVGTNGLAEAGDSLVLTFSEPIEPSSILAGWSGPPTSVVVRINDNGLLGLPLGNDSVQVWNAANSAVLPLGTVDLGRSDYVAGVLGGNVRFGASGTASTMTMSGNTVTIVLGTYNSTPIVDPARTTAGGNGTATWTPVAGPYDRAENAILTAATTESGAADKEF